MGADRTTLQYLLKEFFLPKLRSDINNGNVLLAQIEKSSDQVEGLEYVTSVHLSRNEAGIGSRAEGGTMPTAGNQGVFKTKDFLRYHYGAVKLSGVLLETVKSERGAFSDPAKLEMRAITNDLRRDLNRQLYGDGTGALCDVSASNSTTTIPVGTLTQAERRQIRPGMVIDVGDASGAMVGTGLTITSVTSSTVVVGVAPASATDSSDFIYRTGNFGNELTGLKKIVAASGACHNLNPSTTGAERWKSQVITSYGSAVTEDVVVQAAQKVNIETGEDVDLIVTTNGVHRDFLSVLEDMRRINVPTELKAGYKGIDVSWVGQGMNAAKTVSLVWDRDCQDSTMYGLSTDHLFWHRAGDWDFIDDDGAILSRSTDRTHSFTADLFCAADLGTDSRANHFKIGGITEPTAASFA